MSKISTNIIVLLGIVTLIFGAYYLFTQGSALALQSSESNQQLEQLLRSSQLFLERSAALDLIQMDTQVLEFDVFNCFVIILQLPTSFR